MGNKWLPWLVWCWLLPANVLAQSIEDEPPDSGAPSFVGAPARQHPLPRKRVVPHPYLAAQNSIHVDTYNSDVTDLMTPLGYAPRVTSRRYGERIGTCLNLVFGKSGRLFAFCGALRGTNIGFELTALDSHTLEKQASFELLEFTLQELLALPLDLGYMVFDERERFIAIDRGNRALWVGLDEASGDASFKIERSLDLTPYVPVSRDKVATVVPDYDGNLYYMTLGKADAQGAVTIPALLGRLERDGGGQVSYEFSGEFIENGLAVGPDGVFALTDRALYGFRYDLESRRLTPYFREPYARATRPKPGVISRGSGSTPTLLGEHLIAITDNADDQVHLLVYDRRRDFRGGSRVVCDVPLFDPGASANENSVVASGRSIIVQNWYGAPDNFIGGTHRNIVPGLMRIDVREDERGCDVVWHTRELATPATIKLSTATGLIYGAMLERSITDVDAFYGVAIDFRTGKIVYRVKLGVGAGADIQLSPTYIGPDGAVYQPVRAGLVKFEDGARPPGSSHAGGCSCFVPRSWGASSAGVISLLALAVTRRAAKRRQPREHRRS